MLTLQLRVPRNTMVPYKGIPIILIVHGGPHRVLPRDSPFSDKLFGLYVVIGTLHT